MRIFYERAILSVLPASNGHTKTLRSTQPVTEMSNGNISRGVKATSAQGWQVYQLHVPIVWKSGSLNLLEPSGLLQACNCIAYIFASLNEAVLHTIHAQAANIKASYVNINFMMMGCMKNTWMTQSEQQMEKNSFGNLFGYKCNALNPFQGFKKEIPCVLTLEFIASAR